MCVIWEQEATRGWSAADPGSCSCVTLLALPKKKRKRDTTAAFCSKHPLPACPLCSNTSTHAIYQETQIDACNPPSFLRERLAAHGYSYFKVHNGITLKTTCLRALRNLLQSHSRRETCATPHQRPEKATWTQFEGWRGQVSCTKGEQGDCRTSKHSLASSNSFFSLPPQGWRRQRWSPPSVCVNTRPPPPRVDHGRTRRPQYVIKTGGNAGQAALEGASHPLTMRLT